MNNKQIIATCKEFSRAYDEIEHYIQKTAYEYKLYKQGIDTLMKKEKDPLNKYPNGWFPSLAGQFAISHIMDDPDHIGKLLQKYREELTTSTTRIVKFWKENPYRWIFFTINQEHGNDIFTIKDEFTDEEMLIYSPGLHQLQGTGESRRANYLTLMNYNGECLQTIGIIHYYHLFREDLEFFCRVLDTKRFEEKGLHGVIQDHFITFFNLDEISTIPQSKFKLERLAYHWKSFLLPDIGKVTFPGAWKTRETTANGQSLRCLDYEGPTDQLLTQVTVPKSLLGEQSPQEFWIMENSPLPSIYYNLETGETGINSLTSSTFTILTCILASIWPKIDPIQCKPDFTVSIHLLKVIDSIKNLHLPWEALVSPFNKKDAATPQDDHLKKINMVLQEIFEASNNGRMVDVDKICKKSGLDPSEIALIIEQIQNSRAERIPELKLSEEDRKYALDYPVPPPNLRRMFERSLDMSEIIKVNDDRQTYETFATLTNNSYAKTLNIGMLAEFISDIFIDEYDWDAGIPIMNSFIYMILHSHDQKTLVRTYALEILKLYHHILLPYLDLDTNGFVAAFSRFVYRKLAKNALVTLDSRPSKEDLARGTYPIRPSEVFIEMFEYNGPPEFRPS
jgi:hypothetical protein